MDERQGQIKDRAGLDESRINEEFRDFLLKWGPRILIVVALVALAFSGRRFLNQKADERTDEAFVQLALATSAEATSPDTLLALADQYGDIGAVSHVARLTAGEAYLGAVRRGVVIGAQADPTGSFPDEELLDEELRSSYLGQAVQALQQVADADDAADVLRVRAFMGLAAAAEGRGELDAARGHYERAAELDRSAGFGAIAEVADARIASLDLLTSPLTLPATALLRTPDPGVPDANDAMDEDDPFGIRGSLDLGELGGGMFGDPAADPSSETGADPVVDPVEEPAGEPEPSEPETTEPSSDPGQ